MQNVTVTADKLINIIFQFIHEPPVTTATIDSPANAQGIYPDPVTVTLSATATAGFTVDATHYKLDGGAQQTYAAPFTVSGGGTHTVQYWSVDNMGVFELPKTLTIQISANDPPTVDAGGPYVVPEAASIIVMATGSDPDNDPLNYAWDLDNNGSFETSGQTAFFSATNLDGPASQTIAVQVCDPVNACATASAMLTIANANPTLTSLSNNGPIQEGMSATITAGASDPAGTGDPLSYEFDCNNDGAYDLGPQPDGSAVCLFADNGEFPVQVRVKDDDGGEATGTTTVTVQNVAPSLGAINAPLDPVRVGNGVNASVDFTDPGTLDMHTVTWDWGNGNTSQGNVNESNGSGSASGNYTYSSPGVYTIKATVTDKDGASAEAIFQFVVVYDPNGGFVTGGGWINSPEGACRFDACSDGTTGKATFGFVSKYQKGADVPTGNTEFQFKAGNLNFRSTSYQWLVVAGAKAQFKGDGIINGGGNYGFMLTAIDGEINGGGGKDKFRIKIWNKDNGDAVVYDNLMDAGDDTDPTTVLGGGSIVIHKAK